LRAYSEIPRIRPRNPSGSPDTKHWIFCPFSGCRGLTKWGGIKFPRDFKRCGCPRPNHSELYSDFGRQIKISMLVLFCRIVGHQGIHLVLESIEIYGVRKYLGVWEHYKDQPLGEAVRGVLEDELHHEEAIVSSESWRRFKPQRIRDIFLGFNDGLVEILGAVSGFFAAFQDITTVLVAGLTVAVAGSISMAAGAYAAIGSEAEVQLTEDKRKAFVDRKTAEPPSEHPVRSSMVVGISYLIGAFVPLIPVIFGVPNVGISIIISAVVVILISYFIALLSGMNIRKRIFTNLLIIALAVIVAFGIGTLAKAYFGINV